MMSANMVLVKNAVICCMTLICLYRVDGSDSNWAEEKTNEFQVTPGGQTFSVKTDWEDLNFSCNFTYQAQGGTNEQWLMTMKADKDHTHFSCSVGRPDKASYIFFQSFKMELYGVLLAGGIAMGADKEKPLKDEEYIVNEGTGSISQVDGKFQSMLGFLETKGVRSKDWKKKQEL